MKNRRGVRLTCVKCGARKWFRGETTSAILREIDSSEWEDRPHEMGDLCPDCTDDDEEVDE